MSGQLRPQSAAVLRLKSLRQGQGNSRSYRPLARSTLLPLLPPYFPHIDLIMNLILLDLLALICNRVHGAIVNASRAHHTLV